MIKKIYSYWLSFLVTFFGIDFAKKFDAYLRFKRKLNLRNPQTLADKVTYLFLHKNTPLMSYCTDKWDVRKYITSKGLANILIPTVGGPWSSVKEINFDALPNKFIFKATHGCKMNYIVADKARLDIADCKKTLQKWLDTTYGTYSMEPHYKVIPHRIYAEELLEIPGGLIDYKFHCLNGVPQFVLVCSERHQSATGAMIIKREMFDPKWQSYCNEILPTCSPKQIAPKQLQQMLEISQILSKDFSFVRVDLYEVNRKIYFGELTFSPASGVFGHFKEEFLAKMGNKLKI